MMANRLACATSLFLAALPAVAGAQPRCSQETLNVKGTPVTIGYCVAQSPHGTAAGEIVVPVEASYSSPAGSFGRSEDLHFIAGEGASRVVENLALAPMGMAGQTLHLTLVYSGGVVRVEGALLTPGAITVK